MNATSLGYTALLLVAVTSGANATTLWYNGDIDPNLTGGWSNEINTSVSDSRIYEDFKVTAPQGWTINQIWSNDLLSLTVAPHHWMAQTAQWSIRSGVTIGNGGNVIASGISPVTQTFQTTYSLGGLSGSFNVYTVTVSDLSVFLAPGQYWVNVTPIGTGLDEQRSGLAITSGVGGLGTGSTLGGGFWDSSYYGVSFELAEVQFGSQSNFSMGVAGFEGATPPSAVPFHSSKVAEFISLCLLGGLLVWGKRRKATSVAPSTA